MFTLFKSVKLIAAFFLLETLKLFFEYVYTFIYENVVTCFWWQFLVTIDCYIEKY